MSKPFAIIVHFDGHDTPAVVTGKMGAMVGRGRPWYAVGQHFGMGLHEDQHVGAPEFDDTFSVTWEECEATDEHRAIARNVGERL